MAKEYDLVIVGGGIGGYTAAIRASQLGMKTALVERKQLGGTCLHKGCIPTKTFLKSAEIYRNIRNASEFGIQIQGYELDFAKIQKRKEAVIQQLQKGITYLIEKNKIDLYLGTGRLLGPSIFSPLAGSVSVNSDGENEILIGKHVLLATGSGARSLNGLPFDGNSVLSSDDLLNLKNLPRSLAIIGGGVIGIEWASLLADFGVEVTIVEYADQLLPQEDRDISRELARLFMKKGIKVYTKAKFLPESVKYGEKLSFDIEQEDERKTIVADKIFVAIGRSPNILDLGLENTAIQVSDGAIKTNAFYQTDESHIYAIGDCIGGMQLAHTASREAIIAVEHMVGENPLPLDYRHVPRCVYSYPAIASIGLTEKQALDEGYRVKTAQFPFSGIGKAHVNGDADGFAKIIVDKETDDILGIHLIGEGVTELIAEASFAFSFDATPWELAHAVYPHPSLSEVIGEVALAVQNRAIHI